MKRLMKQDVLPLVHEILRRRYGELTLISGQGIARGERVQFTLDGKQMRGVIKTSTGGRISFGRLGEGKWSGLENSDFVIIVAPTGFHTDDHVVSMFDRDTMREVFDANQAAQKKAGMGDLPNWIAPFHEEGRGPRGVGDGFGPRALWTDPLSATPSTDSPTPSRRKRPLTIQEAKKQLAESLEVPVEAIEIIVRA
jgi:hypothetical protein